MLHLLTTLYEWIPKPLALYEWVLVKPLRKLYFGGPMLYGYGFWGGREPAEICSELTNVASRHWIDNPNECNELLDKQLRAFLIAVETLAYLGCLYKVAVFLLRLLIWKLHLAPESWRSRTPPNYRHSRWLDSTPNIDFVHWNRSSRQSRQSRQSRKRSRSPSGKQSSSDEKSV